MVPKLVKDARGAGTRLPVGSPRGNGLTAEGILRGPPLLEKDRVLSEAHQGPPPQGTDALAGNTLEGRRRSVPSAVLQACLDLMVNCFC